MSTIALHSTLNILETVRDRSGLRTKSNVCHVTDDVTWHRQVKLMTPIHLQRNILKTAGDAI